MKTQKRVNLYWTYWALIAMAVLLVAGLLMAFLPPQNPAKAMRKKLVPVDSLEELQIFDYPGAEWGMTVAEVQETFGLTDREPSEAMTAVRLQKEADLNNSAGEFLGRECVTTFHFIQTYDADELLLSGVKVSFPVDYDAAQAEYEAVCIQAESLMKEQGDRFTIKEEANMDLDYDVEQLNKLLSRGDEVPWTYTTKTFFGEDRLMNIPVDYQESYNEIYRRLAMDDRVAVRDRDPSEPFDYCYSDGERPLTWVKVQLNRFYEKGTASIEVIFDAEDWVEALSCHQTIEREKAAS